MVVTYWICFIKIKNVGHTLSRYVVIIILLIIIIMDSGNPWYAQGSVNSISGHLYNNAVVYKVNF